MIPSTTNKLLVTEDWKKIYQSYRNADFKSYDFETLRRTMISYLRENYPEDFNDYIDSSEYLALIDLIAYLGQNLSFRIDLNARENFLETAERRESVLRLARLINYNAKRNVPASGFLKIISVSTTDNVVDANGINLANQVIGWNDPTNDNWYQQFIAIMNNAMPSSFIFGRPYDTATITGIEHQQYRINSSNTDIPVFGFNSVINGTSMGFEIVSSLFSDSSYVYEEAPLPGRQMSFVYKNDNQGNGSANTGFFMMFKQGAINSTAFTLDTAVPNEIIGVDAPDINDTDVWLWQANSNGVPETLWTRVSDLVGNNTIYNSVSKNIRTVYSVLTRENDQIDLNFSDGSFGELPKGAFRLYYRQSNGLTYTVKPDQLTNINIGIPFTNKSGQTATLNLSLSLQTTVNNSVGPETNEEIKTKAPQNYYIQNRMVTAEDYNIAPLTVSSDILKIKSVNRLASGVSKYFELSDVSGQYSTTNIFADDGILYKKYPDLSFEFSFTNSNDILGVIKNQLAPIVDSYEMRNFYIDQYPRITVTEDNFKWVQVQKTTNQSKGYVSATAGPTAVGAYTENSLRYMTPGSLIKFTAPTGKYFLPNNTLSTIKDDTTKDYLWVKVVSVVGDGYNNGLGVLDDGTGPIVMSEPIPTDALIKEIVPVFQNTLSSGIQTKIADICLSNRNLGLSFDSNTRSWFIIEDNNLNLLEDFSLLFQKNTSNIGRDNSWLIAFEWTGKNYKVHYRTLEYVFESVEQTAFFVDDSSRNYDFLNNKVIKDEIRVLSINRNLGFESQAEEAVEVPYIATASIPNVAVTATFTARGTFSTYVSVPYTAPSQTGTVTATAVYRPTITTMVQAETSPISMVTSVDAPSGSTFLTFNTLSQDFGALDPCLLHIDFEPKYYAFHSNIASGFARVLSQNGSGPVTIQMEYALTNNISSGSTVLFVPIVATATTTLYGNTTTISTTTVWTSPTYSGTAPAYHVGDTSTYHFSTIINTGPVVLTTSGSVTYINSFAINTATYNSLNLIKDYSWQVDSAVVESDGYINPNKVLVSFFDYDDDGQLDDPDSFNNIVEPESLNAQSGFKDHFVYFKLSSDGLKYKLATENILSYPSEDDVPVTLEKEDGQLFYFYNIDVDVVKSWNAITSEFVLEPDYFAYYGRTGLKFQYIHNSGQEKRIDPSKTNLMDVYLLTKSYDSEYRNWLMTRNGSEPMPPTSQSLEENFAASLEPIKSISDTIVYQPTRYKILFGDQAPAALQGTFKAVRNNTRFISDNDIKTRVLTAIDEFFDVQNWDFGQTFYFSELSAYVMNKLTPDITNFVIVPKTTGSFGSLYEVTCQSNEIFINGATVDDIEVIDAITASQLKATSSVVTTTGGQ